MSIERLERTRGSKTALILVTLTPEQESRRKRLGTVRQTCAVFRRLLSHWRRLGRSIPGADLLLCAPTGRLAGGAVALRQRGADLGEVLRNAVDDAFALGYSRVLLIGNDAPGLSPANVAGAARRLASPGRRAVMVPAEDGGFVLLGINRRETRLFRGIDWGTGRVCGQTLQRLRETGFRVERRRPLQDLDDERGLGRFLRSVTVSTSAGLQSAIRRILAIDSFPDPPEGAMLPLSHASPFAGTRAPPAL